MPFREAEVAARRGAWDGWPKAPSSWSSPWAAGRPQMFSPGSIHQPHLGVFTSQHPSGACAWSPWKGSCVARCYNSTDLIRDLGAGACHRCFISPRPTAAAAGGRSTHRRSGPPQSALSPAPLCLHGAAVPRCGVGGIPPTVSAEHRRMSARLGFRHAEPICCMPRRDGLLGFNWGLVSQSRDFCQGFSLPAGSSRVLWVALTDVLKIKISLYIKGWRVLWSSANYVVAHTSSTTLSNMVLPVFGFAQTRVRRLHPSPQMTIMLWKKSVGSLKAQGISCTLDWVWCLSSKLMSYVPPFPCMLNRMPSGTCWGVGVQVGLQTWATCRWRAALG